MFMGEHNHSIDPKGRLIIPSKYREALGESFVITKGLDGCVSLYAHDEWKKFEKELENLSFANKNARKFTRYFLSGASECELDKQGRILIPAPLREHAGLEKEIVLAGVGNRIEIWSKEKWDAYHDEEELDMDDIADQMAELGF